MRRVLLVAAVLVLLVISLTVPVAGHANLFAMIGSWTAEQFSFDAVLGAQGNTADLHDGTAENAVGEELRQVLSEYGVTEKVVPQWLPDGFERVGEVFVRDRDGSGDTEFFDYYSDGNDTCTLMYTKHVEPVQSMIYEKISGTPEIYVAGDMEHYIVENTGNITVAWYVENLECSIGTTLPRSDVERIIDSIYEE